MNRQTQTTPPSSTPSPLQTSGEYQEVLAAFTTTSATKPTLPMNVGLVIRVQGDSFQAMTQDGTPVALSLPALPEKCVHAKDTPNTAGNIIPQ